MEKKDKKKDFTIRKMSEGLHRQLKARAAERGIPLYDLIIEYLSNALKRDKGGTL
jgi:plasmid stability protein